MAIADVILFVSTTSRESAPCVQFVQQAGLPVNIVRLDTREARNAVANGRYFQIVSVPTMVLIYQDDNIQLYVGRDKILNWLQNLMNTPPPPPPQYGEEPVPHPPKPKKKRKTKKKTKKQKGLYGGPPKKKKSPAPVDFSFESSEESDDPVEFMEPVPPPHSQKSGGSKRPPPPPTGGLMVGARAPKKKSPSSDVFAMAKQMEKEMEATRGYREEDLPKPF